ncbi:DUF3307 domain-containing protein [Pedobacter sp. HMF7647]|uniref:DUF3307 domain-containing protein n=1 Tax=Hufsiella arboris TaxID=2695275 RepID=A0A7K1YDJ2_9SPHI|nr:DUF3307 domain-containing protein [Hufsiella arboris]MXV52149.1 DUF3307 domain-containing protein [Hufsiella arboris]
MQQEVLVLIRLILAHLLTDFVFQPASWVKERSLKKYKSPKLYAHIVVTAVVAYFFSGIWGAWWLPLLIGISHLAIDIWKSYKPARVKFFILDQLFHLLILLVSWILLFNNGAQVLATVFQFISGPRFILIAAAYILAGWPLGYLIGMATEKWRNQAQVNAEGLDQAGMWIGLFERFLILTFILINQYTAIGFLIAAKSVLRFSDKDNTQRKTEYVLIGTLMSFSASFVIGLLVQTSFAYFT